MRSSISIVLLLIFGSCFSQSIQVSGKVYLDKNQNNIFDPTETPLPDVLVSDGEMVVKTDKFGNYSILSQEGNLIFPILPTHYRFHNKNSWWSAPEGGHQKKTPKSLEDFNFGLVPTEPTQSFKALIVGDIQVGTAEELRYAEQSVPSEIENRNDYAFSIFLGDLVNDEPSLFQPLKKMMQVLGQPAWAVYGNHDKNAAREHQYQHKDFSQQFGPRTYAFYHNEVLFIQLNTIQPVGKYGYKGIYPETDLSFLSNLLASVKTEQLLVISQHIPLGMVENKERLYQVLQDQKEVLLLSGHTHTVSQRFRESSYGTKIHEITAGAVSGHWWTGQKDWQGIPLALMQCGTPRGYFEIDFSESSSQWNYQVAYKGVGISSDIQTSLWFGKPGEEISRTLSSEDRNILANIFTGSEKTEVRMSIDSGQWHQMEKARVTDHYIDRIKRLQKEEWYPDELSKKSPYRSRPSSHIWQGMVPDTLSTGWHKLEISVVQDHSPDFQRTTWFWFEQ